MGPNVRRFVGPPLIGDELYANAWDPIYVDCVGSYYGDHLYTYVWDHLTCADLYGSYYGDNTCILMHRI